MNTSTLETTDLFRGAFFLCVGGDLYQVHFRSNGGQTATFLFTGPDLHKHDRDYRNGHALVNPLQFREALNHLRDILFEKQRHEKRRYDDERENKTRMHRRQAYV